MPQLAGPFAASADLPHDPSGGEVNHADYLLARRSQIRAITAGRDKYDQSRGHVHRPRYRHPIVYDRWTPVRIDRVRLRRSGAGRHQCRAKQPQTGDLPVGTDHGRPALRVPTVADHPPRPTTSAPCRSHLVPRPSRATHSEESAPQRIQPTTSVGADFLRTHRCGLCRPSLSNVSILRPGLDGDFLLPAADPATRTIDRNPALTSHGVIHQESW